MIPRILIVENDPQHGRWLRHHVETIWPDASPEWRDFAQFEKLLPSLGNGEFDLMLLGARFGTLPNEPCEGLDWLRRLRKRRSALPVVVIAAGGSELTAVKAMRLGAADYQSRDLLSAPLLESSLKGVMKRAQAREQRRARARRIQRQRPQQRGAAGSVSARAQRRAAADQQLPQVIPQYTLLRQIGESGRATVWLARSEALGKPVALKVSKPGPGENDDHQLFAREYSAIAALRHPSIVDIYDYGIYQNHEYLAMEYFPCGDLKQRLQNPITPAQSVAYVRRIAEALQVVHETGMLHRDLKPPNIMLREDCSVVLIDFGLAKRVGSNTSNTAVGVLRGSPYYMSPEQVRGMPLDPRSDLYSLGVVFYEMLTGRKPYVGNSAMELMQQHVEGRRTPLPPELERFEAVLAPLMAAERDDRFPDVATTLEALAALRDDTPMACAHAG